MWLWWWCVEVLADDANAVCVVGLGDVGVVGGGGAAVATVDGFCVCC